MAADLPDTDGNDDGPDLSPLEILLRAAEVRAGWTERERQNRRAHRIARVALKPISRQGDFANHEPIEECCDGP
ncbi:MAG: hypothetical protein ACLQNE_27340 [Thermoguttaceae bacterium]